MELTEIWKQVVGFEGFYEVSNFGNVRSVDRYVKHPRGSMMLRKGKPMKQSKNKHGYMDIRLGKNGIEKAYLVHRLVAMAFIENNENKPQVNHKDGVKDNNKLENIEWATRSENRYHSYRELKADCWLRHVKGRIFFITNGTQTKRMVGDFVTPFGWKIGRHNGYYGALKAKVIQ